jgi:hypothetical protein
MTQEEKQILLRDLCARIPYRTLAQLNPGAYNKPETCILTGVDGEEIYLNVDSDPFRIDHIKPYLRPMSSMMEEERRYLLEELGFDEDLENVELNDFGSYVYRNVNVLPLFDWLNAHHFDYRGLIEKGLALESPEGMYA